MSEDAILHDLDPSTFGTNVRSFEHWFESVGGYLHDLKHGHAELEEEALDASARERLVATLCTYCVGETAALEASSEVARSAAPSLRTFKQRLLELVDAGAWECALFAQNVMLESMEYVVFEEHARAADRVTRDVLERIIRDERRHMGFGENEIGRELRQRPSEATKLADVKRDLERLVLDTFDHAARELGLPPDESPRLARAYQAAVGRLGIER